MDTVEIKVVEDWAVVELMGHVKMAGRITEVEKFGAKLGRLDIPDGKGGFVTKFFGGSSVYSITPVTEEVARVVAKSNLPSPVSPWDFPKQLQAASLYDESPMRGSAMRSEEDDNELEPRFED